MSERKWGAAALILVLVVSGCGGGGGGGSDEPVDTGPLGTTDGVLRHLAFGAANGLMPIFPEPAAPASASTKSSTKSRAGAQAAVNRREPAALLVQNAQQRGEVTDCSGGGTYQDLENVEYDAHSPYSDETFYGYQTQYDACNFNTDGSVFEQTGLDTFACPLSSASNGEPCSPYQVRQRKLGSPASPYREVSRYQREDGATIESDSVRPGLISDLQNVTNGYQISSYSPITGTVRVNGGPQLDFSAYSGTPDHPRSLSYLLADLGNETFRVQYELSSIEHFNGTGCELGDYSLQTTSPLIYMQSNDGGISDVQGGTLRIEQNGASATATFQADKSLVVTDSNGRSKTYRSSSDFGAALGSCLNFL